MGVLIHLSLPPAIPFLQRPTIKVESATLRTRMGRTMFLFLASLYHRIRRRAMKILMLQAKREYKFSKRQFDKIVDRSPST